MFTVGSGFLDRSLARFNRNKQRKLRFLGKRFKSKVSIQISRFVTTHGFPTNLRLLTSMGKPRGTHHDLVNHHIPFLVIAVRVNTKIGRVIVLDLDARVLDSILPLEMSVWHITRIKKWAAATNSGKLKFRECLLLYHYS